MIDFATPEPLHLSPPVCDVSVADDGEILFVGPNFAGTQPPDDGTFRDFSNKAQASPPASNVAVTNDGEILFVGPNFASTWPFLDGGTFGEFPAEMGIRSMTTMNPFLADILASSNGSAEQVIVTNGIVALDDRGITSDEQHTVAEYEAATGISRSPLARRDLFPPLDQLEVRSISPRSTRAVDSRSRMSSDKSISDSMLLHPLTVSISPPSLSPVICETNIDNPISPSSSSASPVTFVVSVSHVVGQFATRLCRMD